MKGSKNYKFTDCDGIQREFRFLVSNHIGGVTVEAVELRDDGEPGYSAKESCIGDDPTPAALKLQTTIRELLSKRYLRPDGNLILNEISGYVRHDGIVVDGKLLSFEQLVTEITTHEGFSFQLSFKD